MCVCAVEETASSVTFATATEFAEMAAKLAIEKQAKAPVVKRRAIDMSVITSEDTNVPMALHKRAQQGQSLIATTQLPLTGNVKYESVMVVAGNSWPFLCTSRVNTRFRWSYCPLGSQQSKMIYNGVRSTYDFNREERLDDSNCGIRKCTLIIDDFRLDDAGSLSCIAGIVEKYWSLTILGKYKCSNDGNR